MAKTINKTTTLTGRYKMAEKRIESYIEDDKERNEGHVDTRHLNFECENPDERLGCDPGIDVAG